VKNIVCGKSAKVCVSLREILICVCAIATLASCSLTRHVPQGQCLLDKVNISIDDPRSDVRAADLANYLRQTENHRVLGGLRLQLAVYSMSGRDSSKWYNKWVRRMGQPPVIYDSTLTEASVQQLHRALNNRGFTDNVVTYSATADTAKKKARVNYNIHLGEPYYIRSIAYDITNDTLRDVILADKEHFPIKEGDLLNYNHLDIWRQAITERLRDQGYYAFAKEYITFIADTAAGSKEVDLTLVAHPPKPIPNMPYYTDHRPFYVRHVTYVTNYDPVAMQDGYFGVDTVSLGNIDIFYGENHYLNERVINECNFIEPGQRYSSADVSRSYAALGRLNVIKSVVIDVKPVGEVDGDIWVDAFVLLQPDKSQSLSVSLEGTNSEGDLGFGVGLDYQHRNIFHGAEVLSGKFKVSYESLSGNLSGLINNNYSEYATEVGITFPKFMFPFLKKNFKKKIQAKTEFALNFDYQARPEYTRIIAGGAWKYIWSERNNTLRHTWSLIDLSFINVPKYNSAYFDQITNPLLRYSYQDHLIMRMGYNLYKTNKRQFSSQQLSMGAFQRNITTWRAAAETAGNFLYAMSKITGQKAEADDSYKVLGIRYAQYVKADADFAFTHYFDRRQSLALHVGAGIAIPYGNGDVLPFEKRFYSGGANSVRGWGVRTLGPGSFNSTNDQSNFIYQCGDIRFDFNLEYRAKVFWIIELAAFLDAGNIWTIRDYEDQPGGVFKFNKFYEQIAAAYGLGIRLDFTYFLIRVDMGVKAFNPATGAERWPIAHPQFKRDAHFHFSVGYPF